MSLTRAGRPVVAPRIAVACVACLLDRAVSPVWHAESLMVDVPGVGPGSLSGSFGLGRLFEFPEPIVSLGLRYYLLPSPHSRRSHCRSSECRRFPRLAAGLCPVSLLPSLNHTGRGQL